jgi:hypothetical protein
MTTLLLLASRREPAHASVRERRLRRYHPRVRDAVCALAMRHTRIADLAASFPALLFALAVPRRAFDPERVLARIIDGCSLAEAAAAAGLPMWLRKLPPEAFVRPIAALPDGELFRRRIANHLPRSPKLASTWLQLVSAAAAFAHEPAALWVAREFMRDPRRIPLARLRIICLWSWFSTQPATFGHELIARPWTPQMHIGPVLAAANEWRTMIALHANLGRVPIADMWLTPGHVAGYDFVPLNSIAAITEEAAMMKNCLRTYGAQLAHNRARLWSMRRNGERVATLRVGIMHRDPVPKIVELEGHANTKAPRELWWIARQWLQSHDLLQLDTRQAGWDSVPLDRVVWHTLWRPYWLAKRRIPEWLPLTPSRDALEAL